MQISIEKPVMICRIMVMIYTIYNLSI